MWSCVFLIQPCGNSWNTIDRNISGFIHQESTLSGLNNIKPPLRLSISPYLAGYLENKKGNTDLMYKGGLDLKTDNEEVTSNPSETQLVNATKISGRTSSGLGIGMLNAISMPSYATLTDTVNNNDRRVQVQPFTNYNVSVVDKTLKYNSYISLINTNVTMFGNPFRAIVTATEFVLR